ncbi:hypothetical protein H0H93_002011, partial [Arthromyces matolae]
MVAHSFPYIGRHAGSSSGFGLRIVQSALKRGDRVIATARSLEKLEDQLNKNVDPAFHDNLRLLQLDVTDGEKVLKIKAQEAANFWGQIDVLVNNAAFKIPLLDRWLIVVNGETLFKTLRDGRDDVLSSWDAMREVDHTLGGNMLEYPYHINIIRTTLNKNLPHMLPLIQDEAAHAWETHIGSKLRGQGWTPIEIEGPLKRIVCQIGGRCFIGLPFCRNEEYCKLTVEFTSNVMAAAGVINLFPRVLKPFVGSLFSKLSRHQAIMHRLIGPEIERRKKMYEESGVDYKDKPNDMLTWILESATPSFERETSMLALRVLNVNFMSIHSTYVFFAHAILNLAAHPEYLDVLREEVSTHLEGQWSLEDLDKCVQLDSFVKESLRVNGLGA